MSEKSIGEQLMEYLAENPVAPIRIARVDVDGNVLGYQDNTTIHYVDESGKIISSKPPARITLFD